MELSSLKPQLDKLGIGMLGITYDPPAQQKKFTARHDIPYPIYSDVGSKVIRRLGLLNEGMPQGTKYYGVPLPGLFIIDADRAIVAKLAEQAYQDRPTAEAILTATEALP